MCFITNRNTELGYIVGERRLISIEIKEVLSSREKPGQESRSGYFHLVRRESQVSLSRQSYASRKDFWTQVPREHVLI